MKVLQVVGVDYREGNGIYVIVNCLIKELINNGVDSELLLLKKSKFKLDYIFHDDINDFDLFFNVNNYDLVVFHGLFYKKYTEIGKVLEKKNIPYVVKPHSSLVRNSHKKSFLKKRLAFIFYLNHFIRKSKLILFSNIEEKNNSIFQNHPFELDYNGLKIDEIDLSNKISTKEMSLFFLSRIDFSHKGIDYLIEGYKKYVNNTKGLKVKLNIYGAGSKHDEKKLENLISNHPLINYYGGVFGLEKLQIIDNNDILILTSRYEGFPTIFMDVLQRGVPAIVTPGTNATFFAKKDLGWVANLTSDSIAETIELSVKEYLLKKNTIRLNCYNFAHKNFSIEKNISRTIKIYKSTLLR